MFIPYVCNSHMMTLRVKQKHLGIKQEASENRRPTVILKRGTVCNGGAVVGRITHHAMPSHLVTRIALAWHAHHHRFPMLSSQLLSPYFAKQPLLVSNHSGSRVRDGSKQRRQARNRHNIHISWSSPRHIDSTY